MELSLGAAFALLIGVVAFHFHEARGWRAERSELLDRLMSRDWAGYIAGTRTVAREPVRQLLSDADEAEWYSASRGDIADHRPEARIPFSVPLTLPED